MTERYDTPDETQDEERKPLVITCAPYIGVRTERWENWNWDWQREQDGRAH